ncbi:MAG: hypothetical protein EPN89_04545 [Methylovulum sp.]|nr:MAG: hypothetical protein EPN89_04545 [Methylovulum sp.]
MPLALQMGSGVVILVSNDQSSEQPAQEICSTEWVTIYAVDLLHRYQDFGALRCDSKKIPV